MARRQTFTYKRTGQLELCADVYSARAANAAVVLFLHGGALIWGSRQERGPVFLEPLLDDGYSVVSADYRLAPAWRNTVRSSTWTSRIHQRSLLTAPPILMFHAVHPNGCIGRFRIARLRVTFISWKGTVTHLNAVITIPKCRT
jgi:hypothetical protein